MVPKIEKVGDEIWKLYKDPVRSYWNKTNKQLYKKVRISRKTTVVKRIPLRGSIKLAYFKKSENFCEANVPLGIQGTFGRACNHTSIGYDGCAIMCCGRPYKTSMLIETVKCNCRFIWAALFDVKCDVCSKTKIVDQCL